MIVHLARDIPPFVMYYVYEESGSSLLIESTDSMIYMDYWSSLLFIVIAWWSTFPGHRLHALLVVPFVRVQVPTGYIFITYNA